MATIGTHGQLQAEWLKLIMRYTPIYIFSCSIGYAHNVTLCNFRMEGAMNKIHHLMPRTQVATCTFVSLIMSSNPLDQKLVHTFLQRTPGIV